MRPANHKRLLADLANDDEKVALQAFDALFDACYARLFAYASQMVSSRDAEDIVQNVFMWLWNNRCTVDIKTSPEQYLYTAVRNRCLTLITHESVRRRVIDAIGVTLDEQSEIPEYDTVEELVARLDAEIESLPASYREAFEMCRFSGKSYKEIAAELGVSDKTVYYRVKQALRLLRSRLGEHLYSILV